MNSMIVTKEMGATTMPIGMVVTAPQSEMTSTALISSMGELEVNRILFANLLSTFAAHERCGVHLYRTAVGMTQIREWRNKYEEFLAQTEDHVRILADLTLELGGDPLYVSPQARMTEFVNSKLMEPILLDGSVDTLTRELTMLEAVLLAEQKCHANWKLLRQVADQLSDSATKLALQEAVEKVEDQEDEHVRWAQQTWQQTILAQLAPGAAMAF
jgi:rubrerythrin